MNTPLLLCGSLAWIIGATTTCDAKPVIEPVRPAAQATVETNLNQMVLDQLPQMPHGGGYATTTEATGKLTEAVKAVSTGTGLSLKPNLAQPSYCSGATYLVFLKVVDQLVKTKRLQLPAKLQQSLAVTRQLDGVGVWGRWNANGPGTARFFYELGLGRNFVGLEHARPGDFLKVWWNEFVGKQERGHSVIFLGRTKTAEGECIRFWSSNDPDGMGEKTVPVTKIMRALVSRFENPAGLARLGSLPAKDKFLASMLTRDCGEDEFLRLIGISGQKTSSAGSPEIQVPITITNSTETPTALETTTDSLDKAFEGSVYARYNRLSKLEIVRLAQYRLRYDGHYRGLMDATMSAEFKAALTAWQRFKKLEPTGTFTAETIHGLGLDDLREIPPINKESSGEAVATPIKSN